MYSLYAKIKHIIHVHLFIAKIYIAPLQGYYSEVLPIPARPKEQF